MKQASSFTRVLIANRGEIAVRIIRACRELGLHSVAVYSQADKGALPTRLADQAVEIGPAEAKASYLNIGRILDAAKVSEAQAVHPGYGFLAENAEFAEAVINAGLVWIGPSHKAIRTMGDKAGARDLMEHAGVPVLPGYQGIDEESALEKAAVELGYPLLLKAAVGGGGIGQRVVTKPEEFTEAIAAAKREAKSFFGDERLILERYLPHARHIEVQVLGDQHGNLVHLFERECSLQRRRQKIVEESPSQLLDDQLRTRMCTAAVTAAKAVDYTSAGTIEFLVDPKTRQFYFLEMNTRIQVEHPVTELVTGLDIVQWQMRIASGEPLDFQQNELKQTGHAIECRIYAEDPEKGFLPQAGTVRRLLLPVREAVRVDAGFAENDVVNSFYDPLLAKVIVHAEDRNAAIQKMERSLQETAFLGLNTNLDFLHSLMVHPQMLLGEYDTQFIEREFADWRQPEIPPEVFIAGALVELGAAAQEEDVEGQDLYSPWSSGNSFRIGQL